MAKRRDRVESVGGYGYAVRIRERRNRGGQLYLDWGSGAERQVRSLDHTDWTRAKQEAKDLAAELLAGKRANATKIVTVGDLMARFEQDKSRKKKGSGLKEDQRRIRLWEYFLGRETPACEIDDGMIAQFVLARKSGTLEVPGVRLEKAVRARTVEADLVFLHTVLNHATRIRFKGGQPWLVSNPVKGYKVEAEVNPRRPVVTYDRFLLVRPHCEAVHPRFGFFMDLVEGLGWRVSALCGLLVSDLVLKPEGQRYPHGRIRRDAAIDKEGVEQWVPISPELQLLGRAYLRQFPAIGDRPLFPRTKNASEPWTRHFAHVLLKRAEKRTDAALKQVDPEASLPVIVGGAFHPYRRKWATERKHLPDADVMAAGGWKDDRSLKTSYQHADPATVLAVVTEPRKLREVQ